MKAIVKTNLLAVLLGLGTVTQNHAQSNLVQTLNLKLVAYNQVSDSTVQQVRITTKDVIQFFAETNVFKGQLQLVTPGGNPPGTIGDLGAFLRVVSGTTVITEVPTPDSFNLFQDFAVLSAKGNKTITYAINRFSIDFGAFHSELQGFSTWNTAQGTSGGLDLSGSGAFNSKVNGYGTVDGITQTNSPIQGTITASAPKPGI